MSRLEELKAELLSLQTELASIQGEGRVLTNCWIAQAKPGSSKHKYPRLKSRKPMFNGKKTEYLSISASALQEAEAALKRGRAVKQLSKRIKNLNERIEKLQHKTAKNQGKLTQKKARDWYASPELIALVRQVMGEIDLDPVSNEVAQQWMQTTNYYTPAIDGLSQPWFGRVWLHPPAREKTAKWTNKAIAEYQSGHVLEALILVKPAVGSKWFQKLSRLFPLCLPYEPLLFLDDQGQPQPKQGNAIFYLGQKTHQFQQVFGAIGSVSSPS